jgi:hypothetical protein
VKMEELEEYGRKRWFVDKKEEFEGGSWGFR